MATPKKRSAYGKRAEALLSEQANLVDEAGRAYEEWQGAKKSVSEQVEAAKTAAAELIQQAKESAAAYVEQREDDYRSAYAKAEGAWSRKQLADIGLPRPRAPRREDSSQPAAEVAPAAEPVEPRSVAPAEAGE